MEIDPLENELDYPSSHDERRDLCPLCHEVLEVDTWGVQCSCGYKENLLEE